MMPTPGQMMPKALKAMRRFSGVLCLVLYAAAAAQESPTVVRYVDENTDRSPLYTVAPLYPEKARRDRLEGEVQVCFEIDRQGRPYRIAVRSSTHRIFEKPARLAVRASSWVPLGPDEERSRVKSCRIFRFELERVPVDEN